MSGKYFLWTFFFPGLSSRPKHPVFQLKPGKLQVISSWRQLVPKKISFWYKKTVMLKKLKPGKLQVISSWRQLVPLLARQAQKVDSLI